MPGCDVSEVIVKLEGADAGDGARLSAALDAFAKWCEDTIDCDDASNPLDFIMTTEHDGASLNRKLIFQDRLHAARFLNFWRSQRYIRDEVA